MRSVQESNFMNVQRVPPQNIEIEQAIIGSCLLSHETAITAIAELSVDDFYKPSHSDIFEIISSIFENGGRVDILSVIEGLKKSNKLDDIGGPAYLSSLSGIIPVGSRVKGFCQVIKEKSKARKLINISSLMIDACYDSGSASETLNIYGHEIIKISAEDTENTQGAAEITTSVLERIKKIHNGDKNVFSVPTGFIGLDHLIGGLQKSELTVIAGRPGMGKTTIAMNIVKNVSSKGIPVLVFSLEMTKERLIQKTISQESGVDTKAMDRGCLNETTWRDINIAAEKIKKLPIIVDGSSALNVQKIQARAKMIAMKQKIGLVVIDYLQLAKGRSINRQEEITEISGGLKALAKDLNIPVVALSQLSRKCEERGDKRPIMSDLRESGSIEQDAAVVAFVYRDEVYNDNQDNPLRGITELIIPKNRYGEPGKVKMGFNGARCMFYDIAKEEV